MLPEFAKEYSFSVYAILKNEKVTPISDRRLSIDR